MTTLSPKLKIAKPGGADDFSTSEIADNWQIVDDHPGILVCTSGTRPVGWGADQAGMQIGETDTGLYWRWTGAAWARVAPKGWLGSAARTTDYTTTSTFNEVIVSKTIVVPAGGRPLMIVVGWSSTTGDGDASLAINYDGATVRKFGMWGSSNPGGSAVGLHVPTSGSHIYSFSIQKVSGTYHTVAANTDNPTLIDIIEV